MPRRFFVETYGCRMNELDSEKIAGHLRGAGLEPAAGPSDADLIILNTCSVREKAVQKVYARLGRLKGRKKEAKDGLMLGVVGCMAQLEGEELLRRAPFVDLVAGPQKGHALPSLLSDRLDSGAVAVDLRMDDDPEPLETTEVLRQSRWRAGVTIS
ncbi:MAG: tRNA (N6-isopentenyl adenosine(37)-C2)-methylthiotransferase MiaB, partial [Acidobacteria bacterium]|nr:tRNA (N6-isopentenyl adenosine(37)-C2)-methylthiotransferase MiaB [Acidobacteriota bacterium]